MFHGDWESGWTRGTDDGNINIPGASGVGDGATEVPVNESDGSVDWVEHTNGMHDPVAIGESAMENTELPSLPTIGSFDFNSSGDGGGISLVTIALVGAAAYVLMGWTSA